MIHSLLIFPIASQVDVAPFAFALSFSLFKGACS